MSLISESRTVDMRFNAHAEGMHLLLPRVILHRPRIIWYVGGFPCEGALGWGCAVQMEAANVAMSALPPSLEVSVFEGNRLVTEYD
jgi:hypothetical protein